MPAFYDGQQDYIDKLNAMYDAFEGGPYDADAAVISYLPPGAEAVPTNVAQKLSEKPSILDYARTEDGADYTPALLRAAASTGTINFPRIDGADTTYTFSAFPVGTLDGKTLSAEHGVTLSFAQSQYALYNKIKCNSDIRVHFRDVSFNYFFTKTPPAYKKSALVLSPPALRRRRIALDCTKTTEVNLRGIAWPAGDTFTTSTGTVSANYVVLNPGAGKFQGAFVELGAFETVSAFFENGFVGPMGVIIRGRLGYTIIYAGSATGALISAVKLTGQGVTGNSPNLSWDTLGQGLYNSFAPDKSVWSVTKVEAGKAIVKFNGKAVTVPYANGVGDIFEVGFVCFGAGFGLSGLTVERRTDAVVGMQKLNELSVWGDSTAEPLPSSWDKYMKGLLDGLYGVKLGTVTNNAISGQNLAQQMALMSSQGFGTAYYVVVCVGTNDVQGYSEIGAFHDAVAGMIDLIHSGGRKAVIVVPWMWYTRAQSGGVGQASLNYDGGARYRLVLERVGYEKGAIVVKTGEELANPDPRLLVDEPDAPLLRDNIHQDSMSNQLYASAIAKAIMDDYVSMPDTVEEIPAAALMLGGATADSDLRITYSKDGSSSISGAITLNGVVGGGLLMRIPRYLAPTHQVTLTGIAMSNTAVLGVARVFVSPTSGAMQLVDNPAGTVRVALSGGSWKSAASA